MGGTKWSCGQAGLLFLGLAGAGALSFMLGRIAHLSHDFIHDTHFQAKVWDEMTLHCAKRIQKDC